jgi:hypothetical protein
MGLGLGFVSRVANRFGLELQVEAEPGKGAEFALLLPVWVGAPEPRAAATPGKSASRTSARSRSNR